MSYTILEVRGNISGETYVHDQPNNRFISRNKNTVNKPSYEAVINGLNKSTGTGYTILKAIILGSQGNEINVSINDEITFIYNGLEHIRTVDGFLRESDGRLFIKTQNPDNGFPWYVALHEISKCEKIQEIAIDEKSVVSNGFTLEEIKEVLSPVLEDEELNQVIKEFKNYKKKAKTNKEDNIKIFNVSDKANYLSLKKKGITKSPFGGTDNYSYDFDEDL